MSPTEDTISAIAPSVGWVRLEAANASCPWAEAGGTDPATIIRGIFAPLAGRAKSLVNELERRCTDLRTAEIDGQWRLLYVLRLGKKAETFTALVGGAPDASPALSIAATAASWGLHADLRDFYAVHNGFGPFADGAWGVESVLPSDSLEVLPAIVGWQNDPARTPILDPSAFLAFMVDGVGHRRGHYRQHGGTPYARAMDWDRETRQVGTAGATLAVIGRELVRSLRAD